MAVSKQQKQEQLQELIEKMKQAKSIVFANYSGTSVAQQTKLRRSLLAKNAELKVAKKTLIELAAKEIGIESLSEGALDGQIAVAFSYEDPTVAAQEIKKLSKNIEQLTLKGGIFEGRALSVNEVKELADLPSKEVLIAKLMGSMQAPVSKFVGIGSNIISGFVRVIDGHRENLEKSA